MEELSTSAASWPKSRSPSAGDSRFSCNICLDPVVEPVVTQCGHLYCWPCLYRWLEPGMLEEERISLGIVTGSTARRDQSRRCCPVCKSDCSVSTLVPIYVRSEPTTTTVNQNETGSRSISSNNSIGSRQQPSSRAHQTIPRNDTVTPPPTDGTTPSSQAESSIPTSETEVEATIETPTSQDVSIDDHSEAQSTTGLRRRLRFRPSGEREDPAQISSHPEQSGVPSRPAPIHSPRETSGSNINNRPSLVIVRSPPQQRASLSHGLAMAIQHVFFGGQEFNSEHVPPLHRRQGQNGETGSPGMAGDGYLEQQSHTTEFLSRLLIMLASFVILCLLLF